MSARVCCATGALLSGAILCLFASSCSDTHVDGAQSEIKMSVQHLRDAVQAKDLDSIMEYRVPDESLFVYDAVCRANTWAPKLSGRTGRIFWRCSQARFKPK